MVAAPAPAEPGAGPWFECRLNVDGPSREDRAAFKAATGRTIRGPTLLYWRTAEDGTEVELGPATVLVVEANNVEDGQPLEWEVNGRPLVIRKKVVLLGAGYCEVSRVGEASDPDE